MTRFVVHERREVAELLAGDLPGLPGLAAELVDEELRAIAVAVMLIRAWRSLVDEEVLFALVRELGADASECEALLREAGMARRAA